MNKKQIEKAAKGVVEFIAATEKDFENWTKKNQFKIIKAISDEISEGMPTQNGKVANNPSTQKFIASLPTKVRAALKKTGYLSKVDSYVRAFERVGQLQIDLHQTVNSINAAPIVSNLQRVWAQVTADNLAGQGMDNLLVYPLQQSLLTHAASGVTLTEMVNMIDDELRGNAKNQNSVFGNQALQIGRDALGQYDGAINGKIAQDFDLNAIVYVGSVVDDTRAQCERWLESEFILIADLQDEIDWAFNNGSGMIAGTTPANFTSLRGGYSCRHEAIPIRVTPEQIAAGTLEVEDSSE
jgi:hypothetical protein